MGKRVVLAMSGGVDSSVAAALLKEQGYDVLGLFMRTGAHAVDEERRARTCCSVADALDARNVADRLDIPFYVLDFEREFARIEDYFADEYLAGRTPNPCVMCNIWLKFGKLWSYGKQVGADFVATGHYARIGRAPDGTPRVARAVDRSKDQSYVLFGLRRELLPHVLFPVGGFPKAEIRAMARRLGLPVHDKPDSQEICFVPDDDYLGFVRDRRPERETKGTIVDEQGKVLGEHSGIEAFTIGQRRGTGHRLRRAPIRRGDRADRPDRHGRPPRVAREGRPDRLAVQLARARARRTGRVPGPDPRPAPRRAGDRRSRSPTAALASCSRPRSPRSLRDRSSPSIRTTWCLAAAGSRRSHGRCPGLICPAAIRGVVLARRRSPPTACDRPTPARPPSAGAAKPGRGLWRRRIIRLRLRRRLVVLQQPFQVESERAEFGLVAAASHLQDHQQARGGVVRVDEEAGRPSGGCAAPCTATGSLPCRSPCPCCQRTSCRPGRDRGAPRPTAPRGGRGIRGRWSPRRRRDGP